MLLLDCDVDDMIILVAVVVALSVPCIKHVTSHDLKESISLFSYPTRTHTYYHTHTQTRTLPRSSPPPPLHTHSLFPVPLPLPPPPAPPSTHKDTHPRSSPSPSPPTHTLTPVPPPLPLPHTHTVDILKAPGADLLSEKELQLCGAVPMLPMHYLTAKDAVVR